MKTYLIICDGQAVADKVNEYITVSSLFTAGETITAPAVEWGYTYTDDERIYNAVCAYIQEGGTGATACNLRKFKYEKENFELYKDEGGRTQIRRFPPTIYSIEITDESITVNGSRMKIKKEYDYTYKLRKTFVGTSDAQALAYFIQNVCWCHSGRPEQICEHVIAYGKKCA